MHIMWYHTSQHSSSIKFSTGNRIWQPAQKVCLNSERPASHQIYPDASHHIQVFQSFDVFGPKRARHHQRCQAPRLDPSAWLKSQISSLLVSLSPDMLVDVGPQYQKGAANTPYLSLTPACVSCLKLHLVRNQFCQVYIAIIAYYKMPKTNALKIQNFEKPVNLRFMKQTEIFQICILSSWTKYLYIYM